ncbi:MAG: hypothetical protein ACFE9V_19910 [Candidatus Hodarchaeota archaeon]
MQLICDQVRAPAGWRFQECSSEKVILKRTKKVGEWKFDALSDLLDYVQYAKKTKNPKESWEVIMYNEYS